MTPEDSETVTPPQDTNPPPMDSSQPAVDTNPPDTGPCTPAPTERLGNAALDITPNTAWTEIPIPNLPGGPYPIITTDGQLAPVSAPNKAWLGGASGFDADPIQLSVSDELLQNVTFPADATTFVVSGMFAVGGIEDTDGVYDTFSLDVTETNGTLIENVLTLNNQTPPSATFSAFSKTLSANLAGRTVRLRATSTNDAFNHTNFFLDSLSFKGTFCP